MPLFEIERYEIHATKYRVIADCPAEAVTRLFDGEADPVDGSIEFVEIAYGIGLPVDECDGLAEQLRILGVPVGEHCIPSIRSISLVTDPAKQSRADTC